MGFIAIRRLNYRHFERSEKSIFIFLFSPFVKGGAGEDLINM